MEITEIGPSPAPSWVASRLGLREGEQVLLRKENAIWRTMSQSARRHLYPMGHRGRRPAQAGSRAKRHHAILEDLDYELARLKEDVGARMPLPEEVGSLRLGRGVPVLELVHTSFDQDGRAYEVTQSILPADRNLLTGLPVG